MVTGRRVILLIIWRERPGLGLSAMSLSCAMRIMASLSAIIGESSGQKLPHDPHAFFNNCSSIGTYMVGTGCVCPRGWTGFDCQLLATQYNDQIKRPWNRRSYLAYPQRKSWQDSKKYCEAKGGDLASLSSKEEHLVVLDVARRYCPTALSVMVGLTDHEREGEWRWAEGSGLQKQTGKLYTNWAPGSPQRGNNQKDYVAVNTVNGLWSDIGQNVLGTCVACEFKMNNEESVEDGEIRVPVAQTCSNGCTSHGQCDAVQVICSCDEGWEGADCSIAQPLGNQARRRRYTVINARKTPLQVSGKNKEKKPKVTASEAASHCAAAGGFLPTVASAADDIRLRSMMLRECTVQPEKLDLFKYPLGLHDSLMQSQAKKNDRKLL